MSRWKRERADGFLVACGMCDATVAEFHEKELDGYTIRLCPDCYQDRPSDRALRDAAEASWR